MFNSSNNDSSNSNQDQNQRRTITTDHYHQEEEEDSAGPEFRSVNMNQKMMTSTIASALLPSMPNPMSQKSFLPLSLPMPMPGKLIRATSIDKERGALPSSSSTSSPSTSPHHRWIIQELRELPSDYILVRTNLYVKRQDDECINSPQLIANRICQTLKSLSITVIDDNDNDSISTANVFVDYGSVEEENILFLETQNNVKFAIRLFSSRSHNNSNDMIVVEIQRTSGCTFEFRDAAKAILRSAANKQKMIKPGKAKKTRQFTIPLSLPKRSKEDLAKCIQNDFKIAYQMIHSPKYYTQVLGLESMEQMTRSSTNNNNMNMNNTSSCVDEVKYVVARSILGRGRGEADCDKNNFDCLKQLLLLLDTTSSSTTRDHHHLRTSRQSSSSLLLLRRKVLTVLANSLEAVNSNTITTTTVDDSPTNNNDLAIILKTNNNSFLSVLLSTIQETSTRPHDAFQAVRCLRYLLLVGGSEVDIITAMMKINSNALDIISLYAACVNGGGGGNDDDNHHHICHYHHHEGLEQESIMLMTQLQQKKTIMLA